jgi:hypothetical protein
MNLKRARLGSFLFLCELFRVNHGEYAIFTHPIMEVIEMTIGSVLMAALFLVALSVGVGLAKRDEERKARKARVKARTVALASQNYRAA